MIPGKKIRACFGFCDIRNFTDATECLQEDVMMFVNKIADVVHSKVVFHQGFPNKNIGDAFLLVWKKSAAYNTQKVLGYFQSLFQCCLADSWIIFELLNHYYQDDTSVLLFIFA